MKKIFALVAALVVMGGVACAGDFYNGDIQIQFGYGINKATVQDVNKDINANEFAMGLQSYHLFKPWDIVGFGFMGGFNLGVGKTENWREMGNFPGVTYEDAISVSFNFEIGPAIGLYLGNVVRFGFNIGYNAGWNFKEPSNYRYTQRYSEVYGYTNLNTGYSGLSLGLQAKFLPNSVVNPVVGWRFVKGFSDEINVISYSSASTSHSTSEKLNKKFDLTQNVLYAAISFSW